MGRRGVNKVILLNPYLPRCTFISSTHRDPDTQTCVVGPSGYAFKSILSMLSLIAEHVSPQRIKIYFM